MNLSRICLIYSYSSFVGSFSDFKEKWNKFCQLLFRLLDKFEKEGNLSDKYFYFPNFYIENLHVYREIDIFSFSKCFSPFRHNN